VVPSWTGGVRPRHLPRTRADGLTRMDRYVILQPLLRILTKTTPSALETVLHVLFLPTPLKIILAPSTSSSPTSTLTKSEILEPGALYANCAVVKLALPTLSTPESSDEKRKRKEDATEGNSKQEKVEDDGELGSLRELAGRKNLRLS
jgi:hypothetical protein